MRILKNVALLFALGLVTISSCKKDDPLPAPTACFIVANQLSGEQTTFTNCSINGSTYNWDFGDGTYSSLKNPTHIYVTGGTYTVRLTATNSDGLSDFDIKTVVIADKTPVKMIINSIVLKKWPASDNGSAWDNNSYPDIFLRFADANNWLSNESGYFTDCAPGNEYTYNQFIFPFTYEALNIPLEVHFYDYDSTSGDDWMGGVQFTPLSMFNNGASVINIVADKWSFDVHVSWLY